MAAFILGFFSIILVLVSLFIILIILLQRTGSGAGMGTAMGGGSLESAFGASTGNVLTRGTIYAIVAFFILAFGLYLGTLASSSPSVLESEGTLPEFSLTTPSEEAEEAPLSPEPEVTENIFKDNGAEETEKALN